MNFFQSAGSEMHEHKVCRKTLSMFKVRRSLLLSPNFVDCVLVYEHVKHTNKALISNVLLLKTCIEW